MLEVMPKIAGNYTRAAWYPGNLAGRGHATAAIQAHQLCDWLAFFLFLECDFDVAIAQVIAAIQAVKQLKGLSFEVRLTKMVKNIPGGIFTMMHNANRRRQHGF